MATLTSPDPDPGRTIRRTVGLLVGFAAELLLLGALAVAAWADEASPPLSFADGFWSLVVFGGAATVFVLFAVASFLNTRQWYGTLVATVLMAMAGIIGFLGFVLTSLSRQETSDC